MFQSAVLSCPRSRHRFWERFQSQFYCITFSTRFRKVLAFYRKLLRCHNTNVLYAEGLTLVLVDILAPVSNQDKTKTASVGALRCASATPMLKNLEGARW